MSNTVPVSRAAIAIAPSVALFITYTLCFATPNTEPSTPMTNVHATSDTLSAKQQAIISIAAFGAAGDMARLGTALNEGLDAGLTVNDVKEVLVQLYAYAGFPRSLNALGELMKTVDARQKRGVQDVVGATPSRAIPTRRCVVVVRHGKSNEVVGCPGCGRIV